MKAKVEGLLVLATGIVLIQFVPIYRTNQAVTADLQGPDEIKAMLENSCYD